MLGFLHRTYQIFGGFSVPAKVSNPIRVGILGAANVAPQSLITPAKQHPEVVVQGVAARDRKKAEAFANKHCIPQVFDSYQALLDDPNIDAWALKALSKRKHVLLEKPAKSNAIEAERLFHSPLLWGPEVPSVVDRPNIAHVDAKIIIPRGVIARDDIRWEYGVAGGAMMDVMYPLAWVRGTVGAEPLECMSCETEAFGKCDWKFDARWMFPNGVTAETHGNLRAGNTKAGFPRIEVTHKPVLLRDANSSEGQDEFVICTKAPGGGGDGPVANTWKVKETKKAYTWQEAGLDLPGEAYWKPYRWQLGAFVDRIRGRPDTGKWSTGEDSIAQMRATDMAYEKSGLGLRPTSTYQP
ncbi:hypothetical protein QBC33DRAFT_613772 [Phialemonium atrogriseum]|uniref:D-xylose 1-dehydrogenase (NADP(+), D-xylono-1,5-lactone-forming) n=1 Tax=Phialemonium atrogriseum TaxID=1093897 RepID=A0AAJ0FHF2_9PEZI|nr:uncharacterized protein QBC33DRAFT_613772 [Phialemonium atrogriseum]KAK1763333.1 hypothetical protein QBC33DRAFT_613772 [Phialemonium atrogriseum]